MHEAISGAQRSWIETPTTLSSASLAAIGIVSPANTWCSPLLRSALVLSATIAILLFVTCCWPQGFERELLWTVDTTETEQWRVRTLILPREALEWPKAACTTPQSKSARIVKRVGEATGLRSIQQAGWVFKPNFAPHNCTPLLVFVNCGSGGRQGAAMLLQLRGLLSPHQVVDLDQGNAEEVLQSFGTVPRFRVLACGGDGTIGWVLSLLDGAGFDYMPPLAILPLGTGNDLARALGWGGRHNMRDWGSVLEEVERAQVVMLDRWQVSIDDARLPRQLGLNRAKPSSRAPRNLILQNYLGIGVDAKARLTATDPHRFTSVSSHKADPLRCGTLPKLRLHSHGTNGVSGSRSGTVRAGATSCGTHVMACSRC